MSLRYLEISDFRNIGSAKLEPVVDGFNIIYGDNGGGKTSLLESIYYLSLGRSFRSSNIGHIIRKTASKFAIYSQIMIQGDQSIPVGMERQQSGRLNARVAGKDIDSIADIVSLLPVQLINSNCHNLLDSGPQFRRNYLDWGAFYHANDFLRIWRQYKRALKQRNAALSQGVSKKELELWNIELSRGAETLHGLRQEYVSQLFPLLQEMLAELLPLTDLKIEYYPGWDVSAGFSDVLAKAFLRDLQLGYTQFGPHRANISILINGLPAKDILSRGQQKLFVCAMILAQGTLLFRGQNKRPIYLVDDLPSELDSTSRLKLIALLSKQEAQIFVTAVERKGFDSGLMTKSVRMFHVEHGNLTSIVE